MSAIVYTYENDLYINLTNKCPCSCEFCIRTQQSGVGSAESLWLAGDPTAAQVIGELETHDLDRYDEIVFCGFGEPLCALDSMLKVCRYLRKAGSMPIRLNTNGLGDLINQRPTAPLLEGLIDTVSISLNAPDAAKYYDICKPEFGLKSFDAMLAFAQDCKKYVTRVKFSIVDTIPDADIERCKEIAQSMDLPLRIRNFRSESN